MSKFIFLLIILIWFLGVGSPTRAQTTAGQEITSQLEAAAGPQGAGLGEPQDPRLTVVLIIRFLLNLIGIILVGLNVYAGYLWMTAGGNEEQITKAKGLLRNGVIGLIIVLSAYSITLFAANLARGYTFGLGVFQPFLR